MSPPVSMISPLMIFGTPQDGRAPTSVSLRSPCCGVSAFGSPTGAFAPVGNIPQSPINIPAPFYRPAPIAVLPASRSIASLPSTLSGASSLLNASILTFSLPSTPVGEPISPDAPSGNSKPSRICWKDAMVECKHTEHIETETLEGRDLIVKADEKWDRIEFKEIYSNNKHNGNAEFFRMDKKDRKKAKLPLVFHEDWYHLMDPFKGKKKTMESDFITEAFDLLPSDRDRSLQPENPHPDLTVHFDAQDRVLH
ncbi:hypothetical protein R1sor_022992 [Riccia sorocarpa]|uniref:Uncharacterized protein n=1 Tax=Riccia sorocarpa TaxID=122646 RepID=A0ABD3GQC7_9MARC